MFSRDILNALMPPGSFWNPAEGDDFDLLLEGIAENFESVRLDMDKLRSLRDPAKTIILSDLEEEYGIIPLPGATDAERRARLEIAMFGKSGLPTYESLEDDLQAAGFNCYVHENSPAVDPNIFLAEAFNMECGILWALPGGHHGQCGEPEAICAQVGGELLVNGEIYTQGPIYSVLCAEPLAQCGEPLACAGEYLSIYLNPIIYTVPTIAGYWPLIFFVGGAATRDPGTGALTNIDMAQIPISREQEFKRIILKYKPLMSWAALICIFQ